MDSKELVEFLDQNRWLMNNGLINDGIKNQLFMYGSIVHKEVKAVELNINVENKRLDYSLYFDVKMLKAIETYKELSNAKGLFGLWRFKRMLNKHGNLNLQHILNAFVKDFCGPGWSADVKLMDIEGYEEGFNRRREDSLQADKQPD